MNGKPLAIREALAAEIRKAMPQVKAVAEHAGDFTEDEIGRLLMGALPAVYVAVLGFRPCDPVAAGGVTTTVKCAAFMVTADRPNLPRDAVALNLVAGLVAVLDRAVMRDGNGVALAQPARAFTWQNIYSVKGQGKGTMLSALTFDIDTTLGAEFADAEFGALTQLSLGGELLIGEGAP